MYDQAVTIPANYQNFTNYADWTPKDAAGHYSGQRMTLKEALKNSVNSISANLMKQMGDTEPVRGLINNMGIDSSARRADGQYRVPKLPSICLGASDLTVLEMAGAQVRVDPVDAVTRVILRACRARRIVTRRSTR